MPVLESILNWGPIAQIRRNHALEHATLQILTAQNPARRLGGHSDRHGFWVAGEVALEELQQAVEEAQMRLRAGEHRLAVHPFCGTNYVTSGLVAGGAAWLGMLGMGKGWRDRLDRLPLVVMLVMFALILAQPLGPAAQARFTTEPRLGSLEVTGIMRYQRRDVPLHRVSTQF